MILDKAELFNFLQYTRTHFYNHGDQGDPPRVACNPNPNPNPNPRVCVCVCVYVCVVLRCVRYSQAQAIGILDNTTMMSWWCMVGV